MQRRSFTYVLFFIFIYINTNILAQDTTWVEGFKYSSRTRDSVLSFPEGDHNRFARILMFYSMRCKGGLVSTSAERNKGCGEWDYSCNTNIIDSTRTDSLKVLHPNFIISGLTENFFSYTTKPTYSYFAYNQQNVNVVSTSGITTLPVGGMKGDASISAAQQPSFKGYFMYPVSALPQGLAGSLAGIRLFHQGAGKLPFLKIGIAYSNASNLLPAELAALNYTEVVNREVQFGNSTYTDVYFHKPISYPGATQIVLEISYHGAPGQTGAVSLTATQQAGSGRAYTSGPDGYLSLGEQGSANVPVNGLSTLNQAITLSFWSRGRKDVLPANNSAFHAIDAKGNRQLNVHLPWSNSRIYWDCGSDGNGYDRIDKAAVAAEFEEVWHHWTFTKNVVTGSMKIYLDGVLWHSATGKKKPISIAEMVLGTEQNGNLPYPGDIDDFYVWNRELNEQEIARSMTLHAPSDPSLQQGLVLAYDMNESEGKILTDKSPFAANATFEIEPTRRVTRGKEINKSFAATAVIPDIAFLKGNATINLTTEIALDSIQNAPVKVLPFRIEGKKLVQDPPRFVWASGFFPILDEEGNILDEKEFVEEDVLFIDNLVYYNYYPAKFEMLSFVTPYGIGLDFGLGGKTWLFDVTDYAPILKGKKRLLMDKGGEWQEEMDIRFAFVHGTPTRPVIDIHQVWPATQYGYTSILQNQHLEPRTLRYDPGQVKSMKVRAVSTGHGQEGEFISRLHSINVNGGTTEFVWPLWKECADNAVYPQGGTWVYDRAGWCPGAPSDLREFEIMPLISQPGEVTLDYGLNTASGDSRYIVNTQLVTYGPVSRQVDGAITDILAPSSRVEFTRQNPFCGKPVIRVQNLGSAQIKTMTILYATGPMTHRFDWTGTLNFLQSQEIALPELPAADLLGSQTFTAWIQDINGKEDENPANNRLQTAYIRPAVLAGDLVVGMKTNGMPGETTWKVRNADNQIIAGSKPNLTGFTLYQDTVRMLQGCYELQFSDSDDDGISWWANGDGDGFIRAKGTASSWNFFQPDFGREFTFHFYAGLVSEVEDPSGQMQISVRPNPFSEELLVYFTGLRGPATVSLCTGTGQALFRKTYISGLPDSWTEAYDMSAYPPGLYLLQVTTKNGAQTVKCIKAE